MIRFVFCPRIILLGALTFLMVNPMLAIDLVSSTQSNGAIICPVDATATERNAAKELKKYISLMTGAELPIVPRPQTSSNNIFIGWHENYQEFFSAQNIQEDTKIRQQPDSIIIRVENNNLLLSGNAPRGVLYAVYTLLEDHWGVQFWTPFEEEVPQCDTLSLPDDLCIRYVPPFFAREAYYAQVNTNTNFAVKLKSNGHHQDLPEAWGGRIRIVEPGYVHTILFLLPPDKYFKDHPEWYVLNEQNIPTQVCWSNQEMIEELAKQTIVWLDQQNGGRIISVSQMDGWLRCECPQCKAMEEKHLSPAAPILAAVNQVAEIVSRKYPDTFIETLAYCYSQKPPVNMKAHSNVLVRLCPYLNDFSKPYTHPDNAKFTNDLRGWKTVADHIAIWDYITNFTNYTIPHPNYGNFGENFRLYAENNVVFMFPQGDMGMADCGDFIQMRAWVIAHLLWNPYQDERSLMQEFLNGYYGKEAGTILLEIIDTCKEAFAATGLFLGCYRPNVNDWLSPEQISAIRQRFADAENTLQQFPIARQSICRERLRRARLPFDMAYLCAPENSAWNPDVTPEQYRNNVRLWQEMRAIYEHSQIIMPSELDRTPVLFRRMPKLIAGQKYLIRSGDVPEFCKNLKDEEWFEFSANDFTFLKEGGWVFVENDPQSAYGFSARMPNGQIWRIISLNMPQFLGKGIPEEENIWEVHLSARVEGEGSDDVPTALFGVHNLDSNENRTWELKFGDVKSGYRWYSIGNVPSGPRQEIFVAPLLENWKGNIFVDRIIIKKTR